MIMDKDTLSNNENCLTGCLCHKDVWLQVKTALNLQDK